MRFYWLCVLMLVLLVTSMMMSSQAPQTKAMHTGDAPMVHVPRTPNCFVMATEQGDPGKEASILKMKGSAGCAVPWHWHPATENIMMVSGTAETQVKGKKPMHLAPGAFLSVPPKHVMNSRPTFVTPSSRTMSESPSAVRSSCYNSRPSGH